MIINSKALGELRGTLLSPIGKLSTEWKTLALENDVTLLIEGSPTAAALAFKVWPELKCHIKELVLFDGIDLPSQNGSVVSCALLPDPYGTESLLNSGIAVTLCPERTAAALGMTSKELAGRYVVNPAVFRTLKCGVHAEYTRNSAAKGRLIADYRSDRKFGKENAQIIIP